ncbi:MAG: TonB-dependent receptor plug domain-containing protein [Bacteroidales bacterium]|nr:TonB-dependent receptor plug domain-containing protein [Bacteroidales bacterium]
MKARILILIMIALVTVGQAQVQKKGNTLTVTGSVSDTTLSPIIGALIVVDGMDTGVTTGKNGTFKVKVSPDAISIGAYTTNLGSAIAILEGQDKINLVLDGTQVMKNFVPGSTEGDMDIDIGYGTAKRKNLTTDVGYIDAQDYSNASYTNIYDMIRGRVPGVNVTGNKITIRGISSINSGTDPLFVVDGIVVNAIDNINPRDVKSITVLKGSDAAIYGTRGANGVILITLVGSRR